MVVSQQRDMTGSIYHERQMKELCALHALNNLFQERGFNKQELDQICYGLSPDVWINPHKSLLGLGNYDINVIMAALQQKDREAIWFDKRRDPKCLCLDNIDGFILNVPTEYKLGFVVLPLKKRHWVTLKRVNGEFYNLDSKLDSPQQIGKEDEFLAYLKDQIESKDKELFLVVTRDVANDQTWLAKSSDFDECDETKKMCTILGTSTGEIRYIEDGLTTDLDVDNSINSQESQNVNGTEFVNSINSR